MTAPEQSVEDILASIKRIIVEEDGPGAAPRGPTADDVAPGDDLEDDADAVLELTRPLPPIAAAPPARPRVPPVAAPSPSPSAAPTSPGLVSAVAVDASRQALAYLSSLKLKSGDPADDTLAALVRELLRPMLRAWLDAELPGIVERAVVREIARMGGPKE